MQQVLTETRCCAACGKPLVKKVYSGGGIESHPQFMKRRFCDRACQGIALRLPDGPRWGGLPHRGRKTARRMKPRVACETCGKKDRLEVHHKDGDATNNEASNLEVHCLWCHRKEHKNEGCLVPGCSDAYCAKGYCSRHYQRWNKYGDPLIRCFGKGKPTKVAT